MHSPFLVRLIAATILARQNKCLTAELGLVRTENAYLRSQLPEGHRFAFTDVWRKRFARAAEPVGWKRVGELLRVAKGKTVQKWHQLMRKGLLGVKRARVGRPRLQATIEQVILRLAKENPIWGQKRIDDMVAMLLLPLSPRTIAAILDRHGLKPAPERATDWTWRRFVTEKADALCATDFFTVDVWTLPGKRTYDVLFTIHLGTRKVEILGVTQHSDEDYMIQTARAATMEGGWFKRMGCRYLIHDGDGKFCEHWKQTLRDAGVEPVQIPPHSPNSNAFAERWVSTVKRKLVRRRWFLGYGGLWRALSDYVAHYNGERQHQSKGNRPLTEISTPDIAAQISIAEFKASQIHCVPRCNGTVRHYYRVAA